MGKTERNSYLLAIKKRYRTAKRKGEFCAVCGYNRKYAIRILNRKKTLTTNKCQPGPKHVYQEPELLKALKKIWFVSDQMCSKRLKALLPIWFPYYQLNHDQLTDETVDKLNKISASTIDRLLKPTQIKQKAKGMNGSKPGTLLRNQIPVRTSV